MFQKLNIKSMKTVANSYENSLSVDAMSTTHAISYNISFETAESIMNNFDTIT